MRARILFCVSLLFVSFAVHAQSLKSFHDPQTGVSFSYPALWSDGPDVGFYLGSEITTFSEKTGPIPPRAKVGFVVAASGPYAGTNLNGVQFVYNEIPDKDAATCSKRVTDLADNQRPANTVTLNKVRYTHYSGGDAGLGHGAEREIYATYRAGQCVLFEESIHWFNLSPDEAKPLSAEKKTELRKQLDVVMQSVRLDRAK